MKQDWRIDPVLLLLFAGIILFTGVLVFVEWAFKSDGQIYQTLAGLVTGFSGAFLLRINPHVNNTGVQKPDKDGPQ